jgi:hypothetical protein
LYVNPVIYSEIANAITSAIKKPIVSASEKKYTLKSATISLEGVFSEIANIRCCWGRESKDFN